VQGHGSALAIHLGAGGDDYRPAVFGRVFQNNLRTAHIGRDASKWVIEHILDAHDRGQVVHLIYLGDHLIHQCGIEDGVLN
jgi:hypothetical protein